MLATAADTDSAMAQLQGDLEAARLTRMTKVVRNLARNTELRPGVSVKHAAEIMWAYGSPQLFGLLVLARSWSPDRYAMFVGEAS